MQTLEQRVENLERELDAAISASARARTEKRQAEAGQKAAELRAQEITRELENTTSMFTFHLMLIMNILENLWTYGTLNVLQSMFKLYMFWYMLGH